MTSEREGRKKVMLDFMTPCLGHHQSPKTAPIPSVCHVQGPPAIRRLHARRPPVCPSAHTRKGRPCCPPPSTALPRHRGGVTTCHPRKAASSLGPQIQIVCH